MTSYAGDPSSSKGSMEVPQNSPIPQFDFQLKVISDSYLSFFTERCAIRWPSRPYRRITVLQAANGRGLVRILYILRASCAHRRACSIESMLKLYKRTRTIDLYLDDRPDRNTVRAAWGEIRDNVERGTWPCDTAVGPIYTRGCSH
jgi:hypothetical protein